MKKVIGVGLAMILVGTMAVPTLARGAGKGQYRSDVCVMLEGTQQVFTRADGTVAAPIMYEGSTYLPLRAIGEVMGKNVNWDETTKTVAIGGVRQGQQKKNGKGPAWARKDVSVEERADFTITIDGVAQTFTGADGTVLCPIVCEGSTYLPLRAIGKVMGKEVAWNNETKTVTLSGKTTVTDADTFTQNETATAKDIGVGRAKEIALANAGLQEKDVRFTKTKIDREDGGKVYEIEFYYGTGEYDYDIDAVTGTIHSFDKDIEGVNPGGEGEVIGAEKAKAAAYAHAGVKSGDVTYVTVEQSRDDGYQVYEVDFYTATKEYEYTIDALRGTVLESDSETLEGRGEGKRVSK